MLNTSVIDVIKKNKENDKKIVKDCPKLLTLIIEFDSIKESKEWLKENHLEECIWKGLIQKFAIVSYITATADTDMPVVNLYTANDIFSIIGNQDAKELVKIHPLWFKQCTMPVQGLSEEDQEFLATFLTPKQWSLMPNRFLKGFSTKWLNNIKYKLPENLNGYSIYVLSRTGQDKVYAKIKTGTLFEKLNMQSTYIRGQRISNSSRVIGLDEIVKREGNYITVREMAAHLAVSTGGIKAFLSEGGLLSHMEPLNNEKGNERLHLKTRYSLDEFRDVIASVYHPSSLLSSEQKEERKHSTEQLLSWTQLSTEYGFDERSFRQRRKLAQSEDRLSYYEFGPKCIRYTKKEFDEFLEMLYQYHRVRKVNRVKAIIRDGTSEEEIKEKYLTREQLMEIVRFDKGIIEDAESLRQRFEAYRKTIFANLEECSTSNNQRLFSRTSLEKCIADWYGHYDNDTGRIQNVDIALNKDDKFYRKKELMEELSKNYNFSKNTVNTYLLSETSAGRLSGLYMTNYPTKNVILYRMEDVINNKAISNIITKK